MSSRLRERLLRFLLPSGAAGLLALMTDVERQLVSRVGDRRRAAEAHARCWLELLAAALDGAGVVMRNDVVRARLLAVLDAAVLDAAELEAAAPERGQFAAPEGAAPDELAQLAAFLERGRFEDAPALEVSLQGALHVTLLERLLERARRGRAPREALLRMLAATLASPRALRRLLGQFPQRQLAGIVHVAMPGQAAALLALLLEAQDGARLDQPALEDDVRDAWGGLVLRALREGWPAAFGAAHDAGQEDAPNRAQPAGLEAWWRSGRFDPAGAARLDALLATVETEGVEGRARAALAAAVARVLSAPDGALRLARALPERLRESLIRFALPGLAPRAIALMQRLRAHHVQAPESCIEAWARLLTACLAPPVSAAAVQALCERLDTTLMPAPARLEAPGAPLEQLPLDELEAWWRAGQADPARAARMERMLALATAVGGDGGPGAGRPLAKALVAALARTVALPEGPRRLAAALPEELGIALLWFAVPALAPRLVALLRRLGRRRASTPDAWRDCWSQVYALCLGPAPSSAAVDALCRRLEDAATPPDAAPRARDANPGRRRTKGALDGFAAWWRSGHADHGRAAQLERLLAVGAAGMAGSPDAAQAGELEGALAAALQRTLASPGGARRLVSAMPVHLREALLARLAPAFASAVIVRLHALARQLALAPGAAGPAPGLHTLSWAQVFEACLSPTATAASVQALCARLDEVVGRVARHDQDRAREGRRERAPGGTAARHGASALERLTAFLRKGRLLGAHAAARPAGQQHGPDAEVHVALLDGLLASPSLQPLWRMLADALARPAAARRMVEQFPERQLRDVLARATPVLAVALCALADELQRSGLEAGVAPRRLRLLLWPALLGAAVRAAAGLAPLPPLKALRAQALDRLAVPPDQTGAEQDGAQWLARIAGHLERDGRIAPARRADMMEAIAAAARASGGAQACLRAVMEVLERGAPLDLEAIVRQRGAAAPEASVAARTASEPRSAMVAALPAAGGGPPPPAARRPAVVPAPTAGAGDDTPGLPAGERIALGNAGMVLMAPYLPRLFGMLGLVADGAFVDLDAAGRAAHLLQFAVSGASSTPEYALPLNKLLCGLPLATPVVAGIAPTPAERETIEGLLEAMIASWSALGRTSVEGLRQSFLMRDGELALGPQGWELSVVRGPFDVLMDRLPWSFSIVRFAWMPAPVHVTWH
ncbi:contractile injection system tape measure protein [Massilia timonae]|nr:contractile injection system tape measure protein [Massilia timonae]